MLSPRLYDVLAARLGEVRVLDEDVPLSGAYVEDHADGRTRLSVLCHGETYRVSCPLCYDTRQRLYVNHRWNQFDPVTRSRNLFLVKCFNEDCVGDYEGRMELLRRLFGDTEASLGSCDPARPAPPERAVEARAPGRVRPLAELPADHHARAFVARRGFDPDYLSRAYGVGYCESVATHTYALAANRLYVPVVQERRLAGWQCRSLSELDWRHCNIPKYYTMPGMPRRRLLYNHDAAACHPGLLVVCEGVTDVWAVGDCAVALFGKTASREQLQLIKRGWDRATVVVLLDGDAGDAAATLVEQLRAAVAGTVVRVDLPPDADPGGCPPGELWDRIQAAVAATPRRPRPASGGLFRTCLGV